MGCRLSRSMRAWVAATILALPMAAQAEPFSVESPSHQTREAADKERKAAIAAGASADRTRIVRRYERGAGWRYLVHVDGVEKMAQVNKLVAVLGDGERAAKVVDLATGAPVAVDAPPPPPPQPNVAPAAEPEAAATPSRRARKEADGVLSAAVVAHGGVDGGLKLLERSEQLTFQFIREVPIDGGTLKAKHVYRESGKARRLDVSVQKGKGVDSTTVVNPEGGAWVVTGDQTVPRDSDRTREIVGRFAPDQLLRVAMGVAADIETATAWRELQVIGPEGDDLVVLRPEGGPTGGLVEVAFSRSDHRLRRLVLNDKDRRTTYFFDDYREVVPGLVVPHETEVQRDGKLLEALQVIGLDVSSQIPKSLFTPAG